MGAYDEKDRLTVRAGEGAVRHTCPLPTMTAAPKEMDTHAMRGCFNSP